MKSNYRITITILLIFCLAGLSLVQSHVNIATNTSPQSIIQGYYFDFSVNPGSILTFAGGTGSSYSYGPHGLNISTDFNNYGMMKIQVNTTYVTTIQTNVTLGLTYTGVSWAPGIGLWWNSSNNIHFDIDREYNGSSYLWFTRATIINQGIPYIYNEYTGLNTGNYSTSSDRSMQLRMQFNSTGNLDLLYSNGSTWYSIWNQPTLGNETGPIVNYPVIPSSLSLASPYVSLGKGLSSSLLSIFPTTLGGTNMFETYYIPDNGTMASTLYQYLQIDTPTTISNTGVATSSTSGVASPAPPVTSNTTMTSSNFTFNSSLNYFSTPTYTTNSSHSFSSVTSNFTTPTNGTIKTGPSTPLSLPVPILPIFSAIIVVAIISRKRRN